MLSLFLTGSTKILNKDILNNELNDNWCSTYIQYQCGDTRKTLLKMISNSSDATLYSYLQHDIYDLINKRFSEEWIHARESNIDLDTRCENLMKFLKSIPGLGRLKSLHFMHLSSLSGLLPFEYYTWATIDEPKSKCTCGPTYMFLKLNGVVRENVTEQFKEMSRKFHLKIGIYPSFIENFLCELARSEEYRNSPYSQRKYELYYPYQSIFCLKKETEKHSYYLQEITCYGKKTIYYEKDLRLF